MLGKFNVAHVEGRKDRGNQRITYPGRLRKWFKQKLGQLAEEKKTYDG